MPAGADTTIAQTRSSTLAEAVAKHLVTALAQYTPQYTDGVQVHNAWVIEWESGDISTLSPRPPETFSCDSIASWDPAGPTPTQTGSCPEYPPSRSYLGPLRSHCWASRRLWGSSGYQFHWPLDLHGTQETRAAEEDGRGNCSCSCTERNRTSAERQPSASDYGECNKYFVNLKQEHGLNSSTSPRPGKV